MWRTGTARNEKSLTFGERKQATIRDIIVATAGPPDRREIVVVTTPGIVSCLIEGVGDSVIEGEPLAELDARKIALKQDEARNAIELADAALAQAKLLAQAKATKDARPSAT